MPQTFLSDLNSLQVLAGAVGALASTQAGVGPWTAAWSGNEGLGSPTEELILNMHSPRAQVGVPSMAPS